MDLVFQICLSFIFCTCWSLFLEPSFQKQTNSHEVFKLPPNYLLLLCETLCASPSKQTAGVHPLCFQNVFCLSLVAQLSGILQFYSIFDSLRFFRKVSELWISLSPVYAQFRIYNRHLINSVVFFLGMCLLDKQTMVISGSIVGSS